MAISLREMLNQVAIQQMPVEMTVQDTQVKVWTTEMTIHSFVQLKIIRLSHLRTS